MASKCSSCNAEILWVKSSQGKRMPLDAKPEKRIMLVHHVNVEKGDYNEGRVIDTYLSHFATCPDSAEQHRKPKDG